MEYHSFLLLDVSKAKRNSTARFPSPYGVSFILISSRRYDDDDDYDRRVSVSLWSIIHSYSRCQNLKGGS